MICTWKLQKNSFAPNRIVDERRTSRSKKRSRKQNLMSGRGKWEKNWKERRLSPRTTPTLDELSLTTSSELRRRPFPWGKDRHKSCMHFQQAERKTMTYQSSTSVTVGIQAGNEENSRLSEEWVRLKRLVTTVASSHESPGGGYSRIDVILSCVTEEVRDLKCFIPSHPSHLHREC